MEILSLVMILAFGVFHSPAQEKSPGQANPMCLMHQQEIPSTEERRHEGVEPTEKGARIRITTKDPDALRAVHEFLRFQITDHQTRDSLDVANEQ